MLTRRKKLIFVHGCFWHMHKCRYGKVRPAKNWRFWRDKSAKNRDRDKRTRRALRKIRLGSLRCLGMLDQTSQPISGKDRQIRASSVTHALAIAAIPQQTELLCLASSGCVSASHNPFVPNDLASIPFFVVLSLLAPPPTSFASVTYWGLDRIVIS